MGNKHVAFNCDIILNEETFDENGNVSNSTDGGIVYDWVPIQCAKAYFDGRGHSIVGLHMTQAAGYGVGTYIGFVGYNGNKYVGGFSNLNMKNVYISGERQVSAYAYKVEKMTNCHLISGYVKASTSHVSGLAGFCIEIKDSSNSATIIGTASTTGLVSLQVNKAINCQNYGDIKGKGNYCAGLFGGVKTMTSCVNYGYFWTTGGPAGGLVCDALKGFVAKDCANYGKVWDTYIRLGGLVGVVAYDAVFINCNNYGLVNAEKAAGGARQLFYRITGTPTITIKNCEFDAPTYKNLFGGDGETAKKIEMIDCKIKVKNTTSASFVFGAEEFIVKNLYIEAENTTEKVYLLSSSFAGKVVIDNVQIRVGSDISYDCLCSAKTKATVIFNGGLIFESNKDKHFYGNDFSGFKQDYKTGKINLKNLSSKTLFGGDVTEEMLFSKGFRKIAI